LGIMVSHALHLAVPRARFLLVLLEGAFGW
jgi:hypothetical protein